MKEYKLKDSPIVYHVAENGHDQWILFLHPLLIGCGEHDIPAELTLVDLWKKKEPAASVMVFKGAGHCVNMDVPEAFNETLRRFLRDGKL